MAWFVNDGIMTTQPKQRRVIWKGFSPAQFLVIAVASIAPLLITGAVVATALGLLPLETMVEFSLEAGEDPGMITFGAMFLASPVQWLTGRSQVRVRKFLAIVFFLLGFSNGTMFAIETGIGEALSAPFLIAGSLALVLDVKRHRTPNGLGRLFFSQSEIYEAVAYELGCLLVAIVGPVGADPQVELRSVSSSLAHRAGEVAVGDPSVF